MQISASRDCCSQRCSQLNSISHRNLSERWEVGYVQYMYDICCVTPWVHNSLRSLLISKWSLIWRVQPCVFIVNSSGMRHEQSLTTITKYLITINPVLIYYRVGDNKLIRAATKTLWKLHYSGETLRDILINEGCFDDPLLYTLYIRYFFKVQICLLSKYILYYFLGISQPLHLNNRT